MWLRNVSLEIKVHKLQPNGKCLSNGCIKIRLSFPRLMHERTAIISTDLASIIQRLDKSDKVLKSAETKGNGCNISLAVMHFMRYK